MRGTRSDGYLDEDVKRFVQSRGRYSNDANREVTTYTILNPPLLVNPKTWARNQLERARAEGYATHEMAVAAAQVLGPEVLCQVCLADERARATAESNTAKPAHSHSEDPKPCI